MPQHTFDRKSRTLRGGLTRPTALRSIGGGGFAAALVQSALTPGAAQEVPPDMVYEIEGRLLEVCTCGVLCPC